MGRSPWQGGLPAGGSPCQGVLLSRGFLARGGPLCQRGLLARGSPCQGEYNVTYPPPSPEEFLTHASETITLPKLRLRAVKIGA